MAGLSRREEVGGGEQMGRAHHPALALNSGLEGQEAYVVSALLLGKGKGFACEEIPPGSARTALLPHRAGVLPPKVLIDSVTCSMPAFSW